VFREIPVYEKWWQWFRDKEMLMADKVIFALSLLSHKKNRIYLITLLGYGLEDRISIPGRGCEFFLSPRPDRLWGQPSLLSD
jgi:hypothetical protein